MKYKVIQWKLFGRFEEEVEEAIKEGWKLQWGIAFQSLWLAYQAVTKEEQT